MGRTLDQVNFELPPQRRERVEARYKELRQEVEGLRELREIACKAELEVAAALNIKQPSVSKIEKQADMYLSTLRNYIEAIGGELEMVVKLPAQPPIRLNQLGDATDPSHDNKANGEKGKGALPDPELSAYRIIP